MREPPSETHLIAARLLLYNVYMIMLTRFRFTLTLFCVVAGMKLSAQIPVFGADSLMKHYTARTTQLLDRRDALSAHYAIDLFGVNIYAGASEKAAGKPEYRVTWSELPIYKAILAHAPREEAMRIMREKGSGPFSPEITKTYYQLGQHRDGDFSPSATMPLNGLRIALDPGHFASDSASSRVEDKYLDFKIAGSGADSIRINFFESKLTWQTAIILAQQLRSAGAEVMFTREYGLTAFGKTYEQWKKDDYPHALDSMLKVRPNDANLKKLKNTRLSQDDRLIFRFVFRDVELRKRANLINAFRPDLTVILHYNVDETNTDWKRTTERNYNMAFTAGSFQAGELSDSEKRFDFLRLLLTDELTESITFSGAVTRRFESELRVPLATPRDATYLQNSCLQTGQPGVFCRNLSLCRLVQGTMVYGETLYQDNVKECTQLMKAAQTASPGPDARTFKVAMAYYNGILDWAQAQPRE
jgi:N-acetylmuramoyl-L-alanine amidase